MTMTEEIINILAGQGITASEEQITATISQAQHLVGMEYFTPTNRNEYIPDFDDEVYVTDFYPILNGSLQVKVNDKIITPRKINYDEGIIYLNGNNTGTLEADYQYGYNDDASDAHLIPLVVELFKSNGNYNLSSVSEGDVSISYASNTNTNGAGVNTIDALVNNIREMYDARVKLI